MFRQISPISVALMFTLAATNCDAFTYQIDDGIAESASGPFQGGAQAWLNSFQVQQGAETITSIDIVLKPFGPTTVVDPVTVYLWTDPTNDGDPIDATVARSIPSSTTPVGSFVNIPIEPLTLPSGSWFFAGGIYARPVDGLNASPAAIDETLPFFENRSFKANWIDDATLPDPNDLSAGAFFFGANSDGNYLIRVNAIPEPSAFLTTVLACFGLAVWRKRSSSGC